MYAQFIGGGQTAVDTVAEGCRKECGTDWSKLDWRHTPRSHVGEFICKVKTVKPKPKVFLFTPSLHHAKMRDSLANGEVDIKADFATAGMLRGKEPRQQRVWAVQNDSGANVERPNRTGERRFGSS